MGRIGTKDEKAIAWIDNEHKALEKGSKSDST